MDIYKQASKIDLKIFTTKGNISFNKLWDFDGASLSRIIKNIQSQIKDNDLTDELSFLDDSKPQVDPVLKLKFDIVKDVYLTKKDEANKLRELKSIKEEEQELLGLLKAKQDLQKKDLTEEQINERLIKLRQKK